MRAILFGLGLSTLLNAQSLNLSDSYPRFVARDLPQTHLFPRPVSLLPNIAFWKRIYSELNSNEIIFSDSEDLSLVYQVIHVPGYGKARERAIAKARQGLVSVLKELDACKPTSADDLSGSAREIYWALEDNRRPDKYQRTEFIRAQNGLREQFQEGYKRSGAHDQEIKARLLKADLPEELIGVVFVESLFFPKSKSSVGATGIWQFMKRTAHEFMRVNPLVDERLDPIISTEAAIRYIKSAKSSLKEWPLIITSYNYGRGGMAKAIEMTGTRDFDSILKNYQNPRFGFAARNYYAEFLAAVDIYKQAADFFPETELVADWNYEIIQLPKAVFVRDLLSSKVVDSLWLQTYNPALTRAAHKNTQILPKGFTLRVPPAHREKIIHKLAYLPERKLRKSRKRVRQNICHFTELPPAVS